MRLSVATNFDDNLPELIKGYGAVDLFGKVSNDVLGGGRASYMVAHTSKKRLATHIDAIHKCGLGFNYLINPACIGNVEFTRSGQKTINKLLDWLSDLQVDSITVSVPYLVELVKARYPHFKVKVGVFADIDTPKKAKFFEELGADCIAVQPLTTIRDFERLKAIRAAVKCDLQLIANNNCLLECPMTPYHNVGLSHASQKRSKGFFIDYCLLKCLAEKLSDPVNYIKAPWIRPEDVHHYEAIGYTSFKILERDAPTETLVNRCRAYHERKYDGNLLDLVQPYGYKEPRSSTQLRRGKYWDFATFFRPLAADPFRLLTLKELAELQGMLYQKAEKDTRLCIDNAKLDGYIDKFIKQSCTNMDCNGCNYCNEFAERAIYIDEEFRQRCLELANRLLNDLNSGRMWSNRAGGCE